MQSLTIVAHAGGCDKTATARALLARPPSQVDGRRLQLTLTKAGITTLSQAREQAAQVSERLMAPLTSDERQQFQGLLRKLCAELERLARTPLAPPNC